MWTAFGCGRCADDSLRYTFTPMIYEPGSCDMDCHVFDQWSVSHVIWGFVLGRVCMAPSRVAAWKIGLLFVFWELWENVIEVAFSAYAPGEYYGDSLVNSVFDMIPSMSGVWLGRHVPQAWPAIALAEAWATSAGFGIHSVFLGHQGSICDLRVDPVGCGQTYAFKLMLGPAVFSRAASFAWRLYEQRAPGKVVEEAASVPDASSPLKHRLTTKAGDTTPERLNRRHSPRLAAKPWIVKP